MKNKMKKILIVGSLNMDVVIETSQMPKCGETIAGKSVTHIPGGKGANQAYAAGKLGGDVTMLGAVGKDSNGKILLDNLNSVGVDCSKIEKIEGVQTGQAFITVNDEGDNSIIVISGANGKVSKELVDQNRKLITECDIVVLQLEIPIEVVEHVKEIAVQEGKTVIVDPAPAVDGIPEKFWQGIDYIKPNETELEKLTNCRTGSWKDVVEAGKIMLGKGVKNVIATLGAEGCMLVNKDQEIFYPAHKVKSVDTTAAGDCFTAAFALALSKEKTCEEAIRFAQKASSIVVTRKGAQTSIPTIEEMNNNTLCKEEE